LESGDLATISKDRGLEIWNGRNGGLIKTISDLNAKYSSCLSMLLLSDGNVASGYVDGLIRIWDLQNGRLAKSLNEHSTTHYMKHLLLLSNNQLASFHKTGTIHVWDVTSGQIVNRLRAYSADASFIHPIALPNARLAFIGPLSSFRQKITICNSETSEIIEIEQVQERIYRVGLDDDLPELLLLNDSHLASRFSMRNCCIINSYSNF
jgi:WD40 repeat protein